jgi:hypothetical protein
MLLNLISRSTKAPEERWPDHSIATTENNDHPLVSEWGALDAIAAESSTNFMQGPSRKSFKPKEFERNL